MVQLPFDLQDTLPAAGRQPCRNSSGVQGALSGVSGSGEGDRVRASAAQRQRLRTLPCQESHNCNQVGIETFRVRGSDLRVSHALIVNVRAFCDVVGVNRVGFLTLTTPDVCSYWDRDGWAEGQRRFHSFMSGAYRDIFKGGRYVVVLEPQRRGAVHWHMLVECPGDIRTGVDFDQFMAGDYSSASPLLRGLWAQLRERLEAYGLGRHELYPVRSERDAIAEYVWKYIGKSINREKAEGLLEGKSRPSRCRRVRYSRGSWRSASANFAWAESGRQWRRAVGYVSAQLGFTSTDDWRAKFGDRWCYGLGAMILGIYERENERAKRGGSSGERSSQSAAVGASPTPDESC